MDVEVIGAISQFGVAGLIGVMWLAERKSAASRDRQLEALTDRLLRERREMEVLIKIVSDNTRAMTALEEGQKRLRAVIGNLCRKERAAEAGRSEPAAER